MIVKAVVSGVLIAVASEVARRSSLLGAVIISLPITSILALIWLYRDTGDTGQVSALSWSILWVIVPSVVFFVALPLCLDRGAGFAWSLVIACVATAITYAIWVWAARRLGLNL